MPFKSKAQEAYFHWMEEKGKLPKGVDLHEWDEASKGKDLPEHVWEGGMISESEKEPGWENWAEPHDSSGEPHTNEDREDEDPEEYHMGGKVRKLAYGGLAKALKMRRRA